MRYTYADYGARTIVPVGDRPVAEHGLGANPFGSASEYTDPFGTQHLRTRTYDTVSMRFTTKDTADLHNLYAYADLTPITNVDPTGRTPVIDHENWITIGLGIAGLIGTVIAAIALPPIMPMQAFFMVKAVETFTLLTVLSDVVAIAGAGMREGGVQPSDLGLDPEFDLDGLLDGMSYAVAGAGFGVSLGIPGAAKLARTGYYAIRALEVDTVATELRSFAETLDVTRTQRFSYPTKLETIDTTLDQMIATLNRKGSVFAHAEGAMTNFRTDLNSIVKYLEVLRSKQTSAQHKVDVYLQPISGRAQTGQLWARQTIEEVSAIPVSSSFPAVEKTAMLDLMHQVFAPVRTLQDRYPVLHAAMKGKL